MQASWMLPVLSLSALAAPASAQCQVQKLVASDASAGAEFASVAVDGDWAVVGAPGDDELAQNSGAIYIFRREASGWVETQKLYSGDPEAGDSFGRSVRMSGDVLVAGEEGDDGSTGAAFVFERTGDVWSLVDKLVASDAQAGTRFGFSVAISGTTILVGEPWDDITHIRNGSVYVFDKVDPQWTETKKIEPPYPAYHDQFGTRVALSGDDAVIGVPYRNGPAGIDSGTAYVYRRSGTDWVLVQALLADDGDANEWFGNDVAISGTTIVVGATLHQHAGTNFFGGAYVFEHDGNSWVQAPELRPMDGNCDGFGSPLALSSEHLIIGAAEEKNLGPLDGSAFDFVRIGSTWTRVGKLMALNGTSTGGLNAGLALSGQTVFAGTTTDVVGCPGDPGCAPGSVFVFTLAPTAMQFGHCTSGAPCSNLDDQAGCRNSSGQGAILAACGSGSVATDDLELWTTQCPPNKLTLLFMAPDQTSVAYGDGIRVVKAGATAALYRLGGLVADATGNARRGPGIVAQTHTLPPAASHIQAGQTWNFQVWYRDSVSLGPCHTGTNFSSGIQVAFGP